MAEPTFGENTAPTAAGLDRLHRTAVLRAVAGGTASPNRTSSARGTRAWDACAELPGVATKTRDDGRRYGGTDVCFALLDPKGAKHPHNVARQTLSRSAALTQPDPAPRLSRRRQGQGRADSGAHTREALLTGASPARMSTTWRRKTAPAHTSSGRSRHGVRSERLPIQVARRALQSLEATVNRMERHAHRGPPPSSVRAVSIAVLHCDPSSTTVSAAMTIGGLKRVQAWSGYVLWLRRPADLQARPIWGRECSVTKAESRSSPCGDIPGLAIAMGLFSCGRSHTHGGAGGYTPPPAEAAR